jgi:hypothetical protein
VRRVLFSACVCPLIVTRGSDQEVISTKFEGRRDPSVLRNYGALLLQFTTVVPDGMGTSPPTHSTHFTFHIPKWWLTSWSA